MKAGMPDLSSKRSRERLKIRREPYWQRIAAGAQLGFRRGSDTWVCKYRDRTKQRHYKALEGAVEFDQAMEQARAWLAQIGSGVTRVAKRGTVREALEAYVTWLKEQGRDAAAKDAEDRFKLTVWDDHVATLRLEDATGDDFREWRERLRKGREPRSVNRQVRAVVAGLNRAAALGHTGNKQAWTLEALADDSEETGETAVFLTSVQRAALLKAASKHTALFFQGLDLTGARPGELAGATVGNLDVKNCTLTLYHRKGRPARLRARAVTLSDSAVAFFKQQAKSKLPAAFLFTDSEGVEWRRHVWAREFRAALAEANKKLKPKDRISSEASAYAFRHTRISELLQVYGIDPLTVGQQTGTSLAMIEKAYFKFIQSSMRDKLNAARNT